MDIKVLIYIIIGIVYVISRVIKKAGQSDSTTAERQKSFPSSDTSSTSTSKPKGMTFEELLKEISEAKKQQEQKSIPKTVQSPYVDYDDNLPDEAEDLEDKDYDYRKKDKIYDVYEEAKRQAFNKPSLEETMKIEDTQVLFGKFKEFEVNYRQTVLDEYIKELKDPEGMRRAVVLGEILNRKF